MTSPIIERASPKVNLTLRVLGRRRDGYHELESLVAFARDIADQIKFVPGLSRAVTASGPFAGSIAGENLVAVTLELIAQAAPHLTLGAVQLEKNLPIAAGIGGGSADAAAVMRAVMRANPTAVPQVNWMAIAARLGADVPVCLASTAQVMTGVGEQLAAVPKLPELNVVLVNPLVAVPADKTAQVFRALKAWPLGEAPAALLPARFASRSSLVAHMRAIGNDLLAPARLVVPAIDAVLAALSATPGCELAQLSGGGPTCFGVFADMAAAEAAAARLRAAHPAWWVGATGLE